MARRVARSLRTLHSRRKKRTVTSRASTSSCHNERTMPQPCERSKKRFRWERMPKPVRPRRGCRHTPVRGTVDRIDTICTDGVRYRAARNRLLKTSLPVVAVYLIVPLAAAGALVPAVAFARLDSQSFAQQNLTACGQIFRSGKLCGSAKWFSSRHWRRRRRDRRVPSSQQCPSLQLLATVARRGGFA